MAYLSGSILYILYSSINSTKTKPKSEYICSLQSGWWALLYPPTCRTTRRQHDVWQAHTTAVAPRTTTRKRTRRTKPRRQGSRICENVAWAWNVLNTYSLLCWTKLGQSAHNSYWNYWRAAEEVESPKTERSKQKYNHPSNFVDKF